MNEVQGGIILGRPIRIHPSSSSPDSERHSQMRGRGFVSQGQHHPFESQALDHEMFGSTVNAPHSSGHVYGYASFPQSAPLSQLQYGHPMAYPSPNGDLEGSGYNVGESPMEYPFNFQSTVLSPNQQHLGMNAYQHHGRHPFEGNFPLSMVPTSGYVLRPAYFPPTSPSSVPTGFFQFPSLPKFGAHGGGAPVPHSHSMPISAYGRENSPAILQGQQQRVGFGRHVKYCYAYQDGYCRFGDNCRYLHTMMEGRRQRNEGTKV